jgi:hypothetical protein
MEATDSLKHVAQVIQLAIAPIFLLTAIAATLTVLIGRLARIVDRGRFLEREAHAKHKDEMVVLERRARLIYRGMLLGVGAAVLIAVMMATVFMSQVLRFNAATAVAILFMGALFSYIAALLCLMREVFWALGTFQLKAHAGEAR